MRLYDECFIAALPSYVPGRPNTSPQAGKRSATRQYAVEESHRPPTGHQSP